MDKTKILIVDDRKENIFALRQLIEEDDVEIFSADGAEEALGLLLDHDFGLAMLDVHMPHISGFELARLIRGVERCRNLPMIFVTAHQRDQSVIFEGYQTGAVDLLFKPLDPYVVRSKVRVFVQLDQQNKLLKQQMHEMERLKIEAESASVAKSYFVANMSHELRTPLTAVLGFADLLMQDRLSPDARKESIHVIRRNGQVLLQLIDDILDFSKIEAQKLELEKTEFDLQEVISDVSAALSLRALEKKLRLLVQGRSFLKDNRYFSDPMRLKQILMNVIGNAIKFTPQGEIRVQLDIQSAGLSDQGRPCDLLSFTITDTGIGLEEEQIARLFQPFGQADASTRRRFGGSGLGLVISRQLARSLNGDLILKSSVPQKGSTFVVTVVAEKAGEAQATVPETLANLRSDAEQRSELGNKKILVVDDVSDNRVLIDRYLRPSGATIVSADSGPGAIEIVRNTPPDLILMDIQMPDMDGYETTEAIRRLGYNQPIIALTAHALREEQEHCLQAGCDLVLTKPVNRQELLKTISKYLQKTF